ncbi:hypothetical protein SAMN05421504_102100 [Amycolatopsis xylanica]|uniref:PT repeat-containing protein n=1 Tax=Amycolatopsis xylanica TaxID=589385 RepID=A0A1H2YDJ3_9PSEU|nr:hypothetical protein [Amycolatopsis xylanica]SDX03272.1 hypothetical protein SAMN05421504_102100 [Amycolatopsis xylanica]
MKLRYAFVLAGVLALSACGGGDDGGNKVASINGPKSSESAPPGAVNAGSDEEKQRAFAKCMREHGIPMEDPKPVGDGGAMSQAIPFTPGQEDKLNAADAACKHLQPNGGEMKPPSPEEMDKMRKQAKCMREHGVDWPDPDAENGKRGITLGGPDGDMGKMDEAMKACGMGGVVRAPSDPGK